MSKDLIEKLILLLGTAVLTGFLVPYLLKKIDERKDRQQKDIDERKLIKQKAHEAEISRQNKIIDSQGQLLENLIRLLWEFQLLALAVSYYRVSKDKEKYSTSLKEYDEKCWSYFGIIRTEISKAKRLTSDDTYKKLLKFHKEKIIALDRELMRLVRNNSATDEDWSKYHSDVLTEAGGQTDDIVTLLAEEMRLSKNETTHGGHT